MAELLSAGATMLSKSCPKCGSPLFRLKDGSVICASCGYTPDTTSTEKPLTAEKPDVKSTPHDVLDVVLTEKLSLVLAALKESKDPNEIKNLVSCVKDIMDLLGEK